MAFPGVLQCFFPGCGLVQPLLAEEPLLAEHVVQVEEVGGVPGTGQAGGPRQAPGELRDPVGGMVLRSSEK